MCGRFRCSLNSQHSMLEPLANSAPARQTYLPIPLALTSDKARQFGRHLHKSRRLEAHIIYQLAIPAAKSVSKASDI